MSAPNEAAPRVLLVKEEPDLQVLLRQALEEGYRTTVAASVNQALLRISEQGNRVCLAVPSLLSCSLEGEIGWLPASQSLCQAHRDPLRFFPMSSILRHAHPARRRLGIIAQVQSCHCHLDCFSAERRET